MDEDLLCIEDFELLEEVFKKEPQEYTSRFSSLSEWESALEKAYKGPLDDVPVAIGGSAYITCSGVGDDRVTTSTDVRLVLGEWESFENLLGLEMSELDMLLDKHAYQYANELHTLPLSRQSMPGTGLTRKRGGPTVSKEEQLSLKMSNPSQKGRCEGSRIENKVSRASYRAVMPGMQTALSLQAVLLPIMVPNGDRSRAVLSANQGGTSDGMYPPFGQVKNLYNLLKGSSPIVFDLMQEAVDAQHEEGTGCYPAHEAVVRHSMKTQGWETVIEQFDDYRIQTEGLDSDQIHVLAEAYRKGEILSVGDLFMIEENKIRQKGITGEVPMSKLLDVESVKIGIPRYKSVTKYPDYDSVKCLLKTYVELKALTTILPLPMLGKSPLYSRAAMDVSPLEDTLFSLSSVDKTQAVFTKKRNLIAEAVSAGFRSKQRLAPFDMVARSYVQKYAGTEAVIILTADEGLLAETSKMGATGIHPFHDLPYLGRGDWDTDYCFDIRVKEGNDGIFHFKMGDYEFYGITPGEQPIRLLFDGPNLWNVCPFINYEGVIRLKGLKLYAETNIGRIGKHQDLEKSLDEVRLGGTQPHKDTIRRSYRQLSGRYAKVDTLESDDSSVDESDSD